MNTRFTDEDQIYVDYVKNVKIEDGPTLKKMIKDYYKTNDSQLLSRIVDSFQKLIISVAKKCQESSPGQNFDLMDLVQEGNLGLIYGLSLYPKDHTKGYNPNKNTLPSTYFTTLITNYINNYISKNYLPIKASNGERSKHERVKYIFALIEKERISEDEAIKIYNKQEKKSSRKGKVYINKDDLVRYNFSFNSLHTEVYNREEGKSVELLELIPDNNQEDIMESIREEQLFEILKDILSVNEYNIFIDFTMNDFKDPELSSKYNKSIMEIKSIKKNLIENIRSNSRIKEFLGIEQC